jgi:hypothetical protein
VTYNVHNNPGILEKVLRRLKSILPDFESDTSVLEKKEREVSYDSYINHYYHKLGNVRNETDRDNLLSEVRMELGIAKRVKEDPEEYFTDPEKRAVVLKGITKYVNDLERVESKVRNYVIPRD